MDIARAVAVRREASLYRSTTPYSSDLRAPWRADGVPPRDLAALRHQLNLAFMAGYVDGLTSTPSASHMSRRHQANPGTAESPSALADSIRRASRSANGGSPGV